MVILKFKYNPDTELYEGDLIPSTDGVLYLNCNASSDVKIKAYTKNINPITIISTETKENSVIALITLLNMYYKITSTAEVIEAAFSGDGKSSISDTIKAYFMYTENDPTASRGVYEYYPEFELDSEPKGFFMVWVLNEELLQLLESITVEIDSEQIPENSRLQITTRDQLLEQNLMQQLVEGDSNMEFLPGSKAGDYMLMLFYAIVFETLLGGGISNFTITVKYNNREYVYKGEDFYKHVPQS